MDSLELILLFSYSNIQMFLEKYHRKIKQSELLKLFKESMTQVIEKLDQIPNIEPNKSKYEQNIIFKKGNFRNIL